MLVTYSQSLPFSAEAGVLPCCRCNLLWLLPPAVMAVVVAQLSSLEMRAHGKSEGVHRWQIVAAPDVSALQ